MSNDTETTPAESLVAVIERHDYEVLDGDSISIPDYAASLERAVLASDWLAEHDAAVARQAVDAALAEVERQIRAEGDQYAGYGAGRHYADAARIVANYRRRARTGAPYICRHGKTLGEHWCDDHDDRARSTVRDPSEQAGGDRG